jgi:hypothetical protein
MSRSHGAGACPFPAARGSAGPADDLLHDDREWRDVLDAKVPAPLGRSMAARARWTEIGCIVPDARTFRERTRPYILTVQG